MQKKIIFIAGREPTYIRNAVILRGLRENGVGVVECTSTSKSSLVRYPSVMGQYLMQRGKGDCDAVFIGFFGQPLVPIIKKLTPRGKSIIFDAFLSAYDTMCFDRKKFSSNSLRGRLMWWLDKHSCEIADAVILDTNAHTDYFVNTFGLERKKFHRVFVGADDSFFYPRDVTRSGKKFTILYSTVFNPVHGVEVVVEAAKRVEGYEDIKFKVFGAGMEYEKILKLADELNVRNVKFEGWVPPHEFNRRMSAEMAKADVCLGGHFSSIEKAKRTIAGKTFQAIAMKKPVVVGDNPANRELFMDGKNALLCEMGNPDALADTILKLRDDEKLREKIGEGGYDTFVERCSPEVIGGVVKGIIDDVVWNED